MFHDIGKGFGGGHSEIGARLVRPIARRMRLNADDGALVEFFVRHHLLMTHTAFRRDLEDEKTIFDFAKTMGNVNNLKMLYLLTFADVKAVGPDVWNPWKASLLGELYVKTLNLLEEMEKGEFEREDVRAVLRRIQARVRRELAKGHAGRKSGSIFGGHAGTIFSLDCGKRYSGSFRVDGKVSREERSSPSSIFPKGIAVQS